MRPVAYKLVDDLAGCSVRPSGTRRITRVFPVPLPAVAPLKHGAYCAPRRKHQNVMGHRYDHRGPIYGEG